jgi:hypothetical protein
MLWLKGMRLYRNLAVAEPGECDFFLNIKSSFPLSDFDFQAPGVRRGSELKYQGIILYL